MRIGQIVLSAALSIGVIGGVNGMGAPALAAGNAGALPSLSLAPLAPVALTQSLFGAAPTPVSATSLFNIIDFARRHSFEHTPAFAFAPTRNAGLISAADFGAWLAREYYNTLADEGSVLYNLLYRLAVLNQRIVRTTAVQVAPGNILTYNGATCRILAKTDEWMLIALPNSF
ncbi:MAG: hypothetical protein LBL99_02870 [Holosporaceae bacterium]|jgi:hypothetical protein|nr:hypothetical protein [Holosporaceae bacterium]